MSNPVPDLQDYEYRGLIAEAWDLLRGDTSQWADRFFYLDQIAQGGQPVLDVGCGTGRLLLDYLAQGIDVDGVDNSPEMLAICRRRAQELRLQPALYTQQMEELALPRHYRTVLVPSSSLQLVIDPARVRQALDRLLAHLEPAGRLAASFMTLWQPGEPLESTHERSAVRPGDGATVRRIAYARYDPATECEETEDRYQVLVDGAVVAEELHRRAPATRSYTQAQVRQLFAQAGFTPITLFREFSQEQAAPEDRLFTVVAHRAP